MSEDAHDALQKQLDLLLSLYHEEMGEKALAELLYATANGLVALLRDFASYEPDSRTVEMRYVDAARLEGELEGLLSTKVICVRVDQEVAMHQDLTVRIVCDAQSVALSGRAVQVTQAGTVIQLDDASVDVQRELVALPAVLRSNPTQALVIDRKTERLPELVQRDQAELLLFGAPVEEFAEEPPAEPSRPRAVEKRPEQSPRELAPPEPAPPTEVAAARKGVGAKTARGVPSVGGHEESNKERVSPIRLQMQLEKVDAALARAGARSEFEFLSVHFSADTERVREARHELLQVIEECRQGDVDGEALERLDRLAERVERAWGVLADPTSRAMHRDDVVPQFQIEAAVEMYRGRAESAKMTRRIEVARDCYRSIVELSPDDEDARMQFNALRQLEHEDAD